MTSQDPQERESPLREIAREHALLQDLVGSFADGELRGAEKRAVEQHLRDCQRCQRELALQQTLSQALAREPMAGASPGLRRRIEWMGEPPAGLGEPVFRWSPRWAAAAAAAVVLIGVAGTLALRGRMESARPMAQIPVLQDALADCRRATARNFPRKADLAGMAASVQFPIRALDGPDVALFSTWKTTLAGSPAAGLAYRWRGIVVVQYAMPTALIQQQPDLGEALSRVGFYASSELGQGVVAVLVGGSGTVLIAEASPEELKRLIL